MKPSPWKQNEAATSSAEDISLFDFLVGSSPLIIISCDLENSLKMKGHG
jgi:hypothetical protein